MQGPFTLWLPCEGELAAKAEGFYIILRYVNNGYIFYNLLL